MRALIEFFARRGVFANLLSLFVLIAGLVVAFTIKREVFPNVKFDMITVTTIFPGASPKEVEKLVTNPLEQDLKEVDGIKKMTSVSVENRSLILLELDPDQTSETEAQSDVKEVVDAFADLPDGAEDPDVRTVETKQSPIIEVSLSGNVEALELRAIAVHVEDELEKLPHIAKVVPQGYEDIEYRVEADQKALARYQLSLDDLVRAIKAKNVSIPGGVIEAAPDGGLERMVRTVGEFSSADEVKQTIIRANELGRAIRVGDVATVTEAQERRSKILHTNGIPAINLTVLKKEKGDAIDLVDVVKQRMEELRPSLLEKGVSVSFINDASYFIRRRLSILTNNFVVGLALVMIVLSLILPFRVAVIVGFGIPFAFLGTLIVFEVSGVSLQMISMMGLIIVLGMVVDDAIVVTENGVRRIEDGEEPMEAAVNGAYQIWAPVTSSVMTTVMAFLPLAMMGGIMGKFVKYIPYAVIIALIISLLECFFILPHHVGSWINRKHKAEGARGLHTVGARVWDKWFYPTYAAMLKFVLHHRYIVAVATIALVIGTAIFAVKGMRFVLFPPDGVEIFFVRAELPVGTSLEETERAMAPIEKAVAGLPKEELQDFTTSIGLQAQDVNDPNSKRGGHYAQIVVYLTPEPDRDRNAQQIIDALRASVGVPVGFKRVAFERVNPGPPVGKPISIGIRGKTYEEIMPAVDFLREKVKVWEGTSDVQDNYVPGKEEVLVQVKASEASAAGLNESIIGTTVRAAYEGLVATSIRNLDEEIEVRVTLPLESRSSVETLEKLKILNPFGALVPLSRVADTTVSRGIAAYEHEGNRRQIKIIGEVDNKNITATEVVEKATALVPEMKEKYPSVSVHFGGEADDTQESMANLLKAFGVAAMGILLILVLNFSRIDQPFLILLTIPLGMVAVVWTFFIHSMPLTFMGILGLVALSGVIVNNAIVFMDFVNQEREKGKDRWASIDEAAKIRIRPIFLTTLTTVAGILPTAYGIGGLDKFVVPIALSLGWGMFFGSILATLVFPCAVAILDDLGDQMARLKPKRKLS